MISGLPVDGSSETAVCLPGCGFGVRCGDPSPGAWLREFNEPGRIGSGLNQSRSGASVCTLDVAIDKAEYLRTVAGAVAAGEQIGCFTRDGGVESSTLVDRSDRGVAVHCPRHACVMRVDRSAPRVRLIAPTDGRGLRTVLMRAAREVATINAVSRGAIVVHASAVEVGTKAVLFAGPKGSGKTTMLLSALAPVPPGGGPRPRFIANDRVILCPVEGAGGATVGWTAHGSMTIVRLRPDCAARIAGLGPPDIGCPHRYYLTLAECRARSPLTEPAAGAPPSMSPAQLCRWLAVERSADAPLAAIVLPLVDASLDGFELTPVRGPLVDPRLAGALFEGNGHPAAPPAFAVGWLGQPVRAAAIGMAPVVGEVPVFALRLGRGAFAGAAAWRAVCGLIS